MDPQTPATEAGRALAEWMRTKGATPRPGITADDSILAIEAEARAEADEEIAHLTERLRRCEEAPYA